MFRALASIGTVVVSMLVLSSAAPAYGADSGAEDLSGTPTAGAAPPDQVVLDTATLGSSPCSAGNASVAVSPHNTSFTVTYTYYWAQIGGGAAPTDLRKNCQLALTPRYPAGYTFGISGVEYSGYAQLATGATARLRGNHYFQGAATSNLVQYVFQGVMSGGWRVFETIPPETISWAPCGDTRYLTLNSELRLSPGTSDTTVTSSYIAMDDSAAPGGITYHLAWRRC